LWFLEDNESENVEKEKNEELRSLKPRMIRHNQRDTSLTPLIEGNNVDCID